MSFPQDVVNEVTNTKNVRAVAAPKLGPAADDAISMAIAKIQTAKLPVVLVGMKGGRPEAIKAVRKLLKKCSFHSLKHIKLPVLLREI